MTRRGILLLALLLSVARARADVAPPHDYDGRTRLVAGVTLSGHVLLTLGLEHEFSEDWSLRGEILYAFADTQAFGLQGDVLWRWQLDGETPARPSPNGRRATLSAGHLMLFARETDGRWLRLPLWHLAPGLRWGLGEGGELGVELPICWFHEKRRIVPIGLQARWSPIDPLID